MSMLYAILVDLGYISAFSPWLLSWMENPHLKWMICRYSHRKPAIILSRRFPWQTCSLPLEMCNSCWRSELFLKQKSMCSTFLFPGMIHLCTMAHLYWFGRKNAACEWKMLFIQWAFYLYLSVRNAFIFLQEYRVLHAFWVLCKHISFPKRIQYYICKEDWVFWKDGFTYLKEQGKSHEWFAWILHKWY